MSPGQRSPSAAAQAGTLPEQQVRVMFDRIARFYDLMNQVMTAGLHHRWRERAAELARAGPGDRVLDVATGTGDLALALARRVGPGGEVVGADFAEEMLALARRKAEAAAPGAAVRFEWGNALELAYPDDSFDAATVGFGARNFADLDAGLREMARVVRPGGRVVVLEITTPQRPPLAWFFRVWFDRVVPLLGKLAAEPDAYTYLPSSVRRFPAPRELAGRLAAAGLEDVRYVLTAGGIIALHAGTVRAP
jgi:demethylmenaquinone methyltransferase / 2-methoxy-6-polyprenyl-1,4-benzoquinol methylase